VRIDFFDPLSTNLPLGYIVGNVGLNTGGLRQHSLAVFLLATRVLTLAAPDVVDLFNSVWPDGCDEGALRDTSGFILVGAYLVNKRERVRCLDVLNSSFPLILVVSIVETVYTVASLAQNIGPEADAVLSNALALLALA
jgi:hypothetical protein